MKKHPRVAIAGIFLESNSFSQPFRFTAEEGSVELVGADLIEDIRSDNPRVHKEVSGFVDRMDALTEWEPVPILMAGLKAAGAADQARVDAYLEQILDGLRAAMPLDAVYIADHGAMTATVDGDIEGTIAERIRSVVGDIPIVASLDLHANISDRHVDNVDLFVGYREDPHTDQYRTGAETAQGLVELLRGSGSVLANIRMPLVPPNVSLATADGPYGEVIRYGQSLIDDAILNVTVLAGFAYSDTDKNGMHVIVTGRKDKDPDGRRAAEVTEKIAGFAWERHERFDWDLMAMEDAVAMAVAAGKDPSLPPLFLVDLGDNAGAGGPANTLWMFRALYEAGAQDALIANFHDPDLVAQAERAGLGNEFDAVLTGDNWADAPTRYEAKATVLALHDAPCIGRRGIREGRKLYAGRSALLRFGPVLMTVNSRPTTLNDPAYIEMLGIKPGSFRSMVLKGRGSTFRVAWGDYFDDDRSRIEVDTPGRTTPVLTRHDWKHLPRPVWPLDRDIRWEVPKATLRPGLGSQVS
jgi:microcystin degradation protein MlrC